MLSCVYGSTPAFHRPGLLPNVSGSGYCSDNEDNLRGVSGLLLGKLGRAMKSSAGESDLLAPCSVMGDGDGCVGFGDISLLASSRREDGNQIERF